MICYIILVLASLDAVGHFLPARNGAMILPEVQNLGYSPRQFRLDASMLIPILLLSLCPMLMWYILPMFRRYMLPPF
jgi:hypothetical protein